MSAARSPYTRSTWYNKASRIEPGKDHLFSEIDEEKHTRRRAQMAAGYSGKENLALESDIDARVEELLDLVRNKYASTVGEEAKVMDLGKKIQYFTLDVISTVGFGHPFGDLKADADLNDYIKSDEEGLSILKVCLALGLIPIMQWPPIARLLGPGPKGT
jgi:cytochrome P450